jgi:hypothetical protein
MSPQEKTFKGRFIVLISDLRHFRQRIPALTMQEICLEVDGIIERAVNLPDEDDEDAPPPPADPAEEPASA